MSSTQTVPTSIGGHARHFGSAAIGLLALVLVIAVAVVTLALTHGDAKPSTVPVHVPLTWNTPNCPIHGQC
jgi:hypothetical protein